MSRAVVTGSAGFLGRHFAAALTDRGMDVIGIDIRNEPGEPLDALDWFPSHGGADLIVHCAAVVGGRQVIEHDPMAQVVDFELDAAMFRWAVRTETPVVYVSSSAAYPIRYQDGSSQWEPLQEDDIVLTDRLDWAIGDWTLLWMPDSLYGWTKLTGERIAQEARRHIPVHIIRPFSGYGADQNLDYPFPSFIDRARRQATPFDVWGDGKQIRDWIHISDIVSATLTMVSEGIMGPVNLCTGIGTSMDELAAQCMAVAGYEAPIQHNLGAPSGVAYRVGDPSLLNTFYQPKVSVEQGIREALDQEATR